MARCARCGGQTEQLMWGLVCAECDKILDHEHTEFIESRNKSLTDSLHRLIAAVKQAQDISAWPVCGQGDPVGDELREALGEAEGLVEKITMG